MIDRLEQVDPQSSADEFTAEYIEMAVWEALASLRSPGAGEFFGRIDGPAPDGTPEQWYVGRRHAGNAIMTRWSSIGGRRFRLPSTGPPQSTRWGWTFVAGSRWSTAR